MITVGITGRSGCGKSTVTACFAARGVPVADADQISRQVLQPGSPVLAQLAARFGGDILSGEGVLDRRLLADRRVRALLLLSWLPPAFVVVPEALLIAYAGRRRGVADLPA